MTSVKLVAEWRVGTTLYRLVKGDYFVLEKADKDALGDTCWVEVDRWWRHGLTSMGVKENILCEGLADLALHLDGLRFRLKGLEK